MEYPLLGYHLFNDVYVLSFYDRARDDPRYPEALGLFQSKLDGRGRVVVERPNRKLTDLSFCAAGRPSVAGDGPVSRDRVEPGTMISLLARG